MKVGVLFPGQGSQFVGMGSDLFEARPDLLVEAAGDLLDFSLRDLCLSGPEEELTRTEHAQPALFALSYALWEEFSKALDVTPAGGAGHSLGEYTALAASGMFDFRSALGVVARRGNAMARAADASDSGMAALLGADRDTAERVSADRRAEGGSLRVANINAPGQIVVAGSSDDIDWLVANAREAGLRRAIPLKVAGAFHSPFMASAAAEVGETLEGVVMGEPRFPVWANTTASPHSPHLVAELLTRQVVEPVLFSDSLEAMADSGIDTFVHVGPGDVTAALAKRTVASATVVTVSGLEDIHEAVETIVTMQDT